MTAAELMKLTARKPDYRLTYGQDPNQYGERACRKMVGLIRLCPCPWWLLDVLCDGARYGPDGR